MPSGAVISTSGPDRTRVTAYLTSRRDASGYVSGSQLGHERDPAVIFHILD